MTQHMSWPDAFALVGALGIFFAFIAYAIHRSSE